jgi:ligand-binding sensor domain-containing protein/signal transduction histidine kinase
MYNKKINPAITSLLKLFACLLIIYLPVFGLDPTIPINKYKHEVWSSREGLPQNSVKAIIQTRDGYLWLGTNNGLARFDGKTFTVFDNESSPSINSTYINALLEDGEGALWIGTNNGLYKMRSKKFTYYHKREGLPVPIVRSLSLSRDGTIWIGTWGGGVSTVRNGQISAFRPDLINNLVNSVYCSEDDSVWIGTEDGLYRVIGEKVIRYRVEDGFKSKRISALIEDQRGGMWIGTGEGALSYFKDGKFTNYTSKDGLSSKAIASLHIDRDGTLWVGTWGDGLSKFYNGRFQSLNVEDNLIDSTILAIYEDREGSLWVGSTRDGLYHFKDAQFITYTQKDGLSGNSVTTVYESKDGTVWIGGSNGTLTRLKDNQFTSYSWKDGLMGDTITSIGEDKEGNIWISSNSGIVRFKDGNFSIYTDKLGLQGEKVYAIYRDREDGLWFGANKIYRFKNEGHNLYTKDGWIPTEHPNFFKEDLEGKLWIGSDTLNYIKDGKISKDIISIGCSAIHIDQDNTLWVGTWDFGLYRVKDEKLTQYSTKDGLPSNGIFQVLEDNSGNLWMSSNKGIFRVSKKELNDYADGKIRAINAVHYNENDGLLSSVCYGGSYPAGYKTRDGKLWFPTNKGVAVIDPNKIRVNSVPPPVYIEQVLIDKQIIDLSRKVEIEPGKGELEFHYTGLSYLVPERVKFKYRLEGFDQDWIDAGTRRTAYYTNIPSGDYTFKVIACNNDGIWNQEGTTFNFRMKPHFYQTYWFYTGCFAMLGLSLYSLHLLRLRQIRMRFDAITAERSRIARDIHDTLAQDIGGILALLGAIKTNLYNSPHEADRQLDRVRHVASYIMEETRRFIWDLRPISLEDKNFINILSDIIHQTARDRSIEISFQVYGEMQPTSALVETNLLKIGQELITNAVKYSQAEQIKVELHYTKEIIRLDIRDDGCGFDDKSIATTSGHFGLLGIKERVEQIQGSLTIDTAPGQGTSIKIEIPIKQRKKFW